MKLYRKKSTQTVHDEWWWRDANTAIIIERALFATGERFIVSAKSPRCTGIDIFCLGLTHRGPSVIVCHPMRHVLDSGEVPS